jgi:hypothetical protein
MNNDLYHWHAEHAVRYEMHEIDRAAEQARLLREAGLAGQGVGGWLARALQALGTLLNARRKSLQDRRPAAAGAFQEKSPRSA